MTVSIVFDLDGTLIDSVPDVTAALNRLLSSVNRRQLDLGEVKTMVGMGAGPMIEKAFSATGDFLSADQLKDVIDQYLTFYKQHPADETIIYPGVVDVLETCFTNGIKMGICTNKPFIMTQLILHELDMAKYFCGVTGGDNVPFNKPSGKHIEATLDLMGASTESAIMVGDSETDINAAKDVNIPVIAVDYGYSNQPIHSLNADYVISSFSELPHVIDNFLNARLVFDE